MVSVCCQSCSQSLCFPWPAVGKWELWEQPFQAWAIDADCAVKLDGQNSAISFVISKWLLPELSFSDRWSRQRRLWERDWHAVPFRHRVCLYSVSRPPEANPRFVLSFYRQDTEHHYDWRSFFFSWLSWWSQLTKPANRRHPRWITPLLGMRTTLSSSMSTHHAWRPAWMMENAPVSITTS